MEETLQKVMQVWMETDVEPRLIVRDDLRPEWINPSAERILSDPNSVLYCNGRLRSRSPNVAPELRTFVSEATEAGATHCLTDARSGEHMVLTTARLDDRVAITLRWPDHGAPVKLVDLRQAFGLTEADRCVAERLMNGHTAEETAGELGVSLETIRTHIKRAYAKLGVCSREAFFTKLREFVVRAG